MPAYEEELFGPIASLIKVKNEDAFENIFSDSSSWGKLFPCGSHDMRRSFTTWNHMKGVPILKIALALGHEELKNMDHYNQDRFRDYNELLLKDTNLLPEEITKDEAERFALFSKRTIKDELMVELATTFKLKVKKRINGKGVRYVTRYLVAGLKDKLLSKYKEWKDDIEYKGFYMDIDKKEKSDKISKATDEVAQQIKMFLKKI